MAAGTPSSLVMQWPRRSSTLRVMLTNDGSASNRRVTAPQSVSRRHVGNSSKGTDNGDGAEKLSSEDPDADSDDYYAVAGDLYQRGGTPVGSLFAGALRGRVSRSDGDAQDAAQDVWNASAALQQTAGNHPSSSREAPAQSASEEDHRVSSAEDELEVGWDSVSEASKQYVNAASPHSWPSGKRRFSAMTHSCVKQHRRFAHVQAVPAPADTDTADRIHGRSQRASLSSEVDLSFPRHPSPTPYDIFHLPRTCSPAEIKARWYELVRVLHPDRLEGQRLAEGSSEEARQRASKRAHEDFKTVVSAYELLKDTRKRSMYDTSGYGWGRGGATASGAGSSQDADMYRWTEHLRRHNAARDPRDWRTHDRYGWQRAAGGSSAYSSSFYGFTPPAPNASGPRYASNHSFFLGVFLVTWILGYAQFERLSAQSRRAVERADKSHMDAHKSLTGARTYARSDEGKRWMDAVRRKAREAEKAGDTMGVEGATRTSALMVEGPSAGSASSYGIGHGGPSGKEYAEERWARANELRERKTGAKVSSQSNVEF